MPTPSRTTPRPSSPCCSAWVSTSSCSPGTTPAPPPRRGWTGYCPSTRMKRSAASGARAAPSAWPATASTTLRPATVDSVLAIEAADLTPVSGSLSGVVASASRLRRRHTQPLPETEPPVSSPGPSPLPTVPRQHSTAQPPQPRADTARPSGAATPRSRTRCEVWGWTRRPPPNTGRQSTAPTTSAGDLRCGLGPTGPCIAPGQPMGSRPDPADARGGMRFGGVSR